MKTNLIITLFFAAMAFNLFTNSTNEMPSPCDSPVVGDHSGAPGETNCTGCHSGPVNPDKVNLTFELDGKDSTYKPGTSYLIHVGIQRKGHDKYGFVSTSLDTLNKSKGTYTIINSVTTRKFSSGGRNYISHTPCGADSVDRISWDYTWTAPPTNVGKIKFYISTLVANHDHSLSGDTTYTKVINLFPFQSTDVGNFDTESIKIFPNPATDVITISGLNESKITHLSVTDVTGMKVIEQKIISSAIYKLNLNNYSLSAGMYFLNINTENSSYQKILFKQ